MTLTPKGWQTRKKRRQGMRSVSSEKSRSVKQSRRPGGKDIQHPTRTIAFSSWLTILLIHSTAGERSKRGAMSLTTVLKTHVCSQTLAPPVCQPSTQEAEAERVPWVWDQHELHVRFHVKNQRKTNNNETPWIRYRQDIPQHSDSYLYGLPQGHVCACL